MQSLLTLQWLHWQVTDTTLLYHLVHGLHTLTAVPRSTYTSTVHGTIEMSDGFALSNSQWQ